MKFKKMLLISLFLLAILSVGAVSAADNDTSDVISDSVENDISSVANDVQADTVKETTIKDDAKTETNTQEKTPKASTENKNTLGGEKPLTYDFNWDYTDEYGDEIHFRTTLPGDSTANLKLNFNGKDYGFKYIEDEYLDDYGEKVKHRYGYLTINTAELPTLGKYTATLTYPGDAIYTSASETQPIDVNPKIKKPQEMSVGEQETITITAPKTSTGNAVLYKGTYNNVLHAWEYNTHLATATMVNGVITIPLNTLHKDYYRLKLEYTIDGKKDDLNFNLDVKTNSPEISAKVTPTVITVGNSVTLTFTAPASKETQASILLDGEFYKSIGLSKGSVQETITGLSIGQHKIKIEYEANGEFYSNTFIITVNKAPVKKASKITASKKTFKRKTKTKKYTITLKSGTKAINKAAVTLTVGKKTYKATTNSKGKATFKITKLTKKGTYTATIKFKGNTSYKASSKKVKITVKK